MGSVSVQSQVSSRGESLSAAVDGELFGEAQLDSLLSAFNNDDRAAWSLHHLIGDVLRSDDLAIRPAASSAFLATFSARLVDEPHVLAPVAKPVPAGVASGRAQMLRRRAVPAFAVAAAVAALTWIVVPQMQGVTGSSQNASQIASASRDSGLQRASLTPSDSAQVQVVAQDANIIRDASLDQYLEAHQQFAQQPVLPGSMPLVRAAVTTQGQ